MGTKRKLVTAETIAHNERERKVLENVRINLVTRKGIKYRIRLHDEEGKY